MKDGSKERDGQHGDPMSAVKKALIAVREMKQKLDAVEQARTEPIAVVGIGCRLPSGVEGPDAFWQLLVEGRDAVGEVPRDRWDIDALYDPDRAAPGKVVTRRIASLGPVDRFDPEFFGISPREAMSMDPQQRLVLEVAWEAIEDAGLVAGSLAGGRVGVFMGVMHRDFAFLLVERLASIDAYTNTSTHYSIIANRVSFTFDLKGPSLAVDTACSSSLVAVHLAAQGLRRRECDAALVGGVNLILTPMQSIAYSKWGMLSPDGRCYTFDSRANGYVRGEGCGVVVLKRLSDAVAGGDHVRAIIRGTAVGQDGKTTVITAPSGLAQKQVIREALADGGVDPALVTYVEAHGTGTPLGDPIEVEALAAVYGKPARHPCVLGAAKTNLGHLEGAAGITGFIKAVLCVERGAIPRNLNFEKMNPHLPLAGSRLELATEQRAWELPDQHRFAGVSSFGAGGTNVHVVLEEAPAARSVAAAPERPAELLVLSARSAAALDAQASRLRDHLDAHAEIALGDLAFSLATTRTPMEHRLAIAATSREALRAALAASAEGQVPAGAVRGRLPVGGAPKVVFVFPGQGSQWLGMGRQLLAEEPVFRAALEECDRAIQAEAGFSLLAELAADEAASQIGRIDVVQPVLFAIEVALAALWRSWGVEPDAVVGHSMGEVAAAHVAGALSLGDAAAIICRRSRLLRRISGQGEMAVVELSFAEASAALAGYEDRLSVAVSNSPLSTVLSGEPAALSEVLASLDAKGVFCKRVKVDVASHSPQVDPLRADLIAALAGLRPLAAAVPMRSTVTGAAVAGPDLDAGYWADNLRRPVRFAEAVQALLEQRHGLFVEMSPHPILMTSVDEIRRAAKRGGAVVGSLRRGQDERPAMLEALGALWAQGYPVVWARQFPLGGRRVPLPTYPWQRQRYWLEAPAGGAVGRVPWAQVSTPPAGTSGPVVQRSTNGEDGFLDLAWEVAAVPAPRLTAGRWLLVGAGGELGATLRSALEAAGHGVVHATASPTSFAGARELLVEAFGGDAPTAVVHLGSLDGGLELDVEAVEAALVRGCDSVLWTVQALADVGYQDGPRLWLLTRGAQPAGALSVAQAPLLGLGRVIAMEHPELRCGRVDLDPTHPAGEVEALLAELLAGDAEDEVALRGGERRVARLVHRAPEIERREAQGRAPIRAEGSYLVTGGLGGLGLSVAGWLAEQGAGHLVLVGRSGAVSAEQRAAVAALEARGARVTVAKADVADRAQIQGVLDQVAGSGMPLRGVIHAAGLLDDGLLTQQTPARFRAVMAPKVLGALHLHELTSGAPLDFFVMYSSVAGLLGSPGQGNYAAANTFLDALAHHRRALGLPALSIDWGAFSEVGLAAAQENRGARLVSRGMRSLTPAEGLSALGRLLGGDRAQAGVAPLDLRQWVEFYPVAASSRMLSRLLAAQRGGAGPAAQEISLFRRLERTPEEARYAVVTGTLRSMAGRSLRLAADQLDVHQPLTAYGLDSLMSVEIRNALTSLGVTISGAKLLKGASLEELTQEILARFEAGERGDDALPAVSSVVAPAAAPSLQTMESPARRSDAQAIVADGWLLVPAPRPEARFRLFCFPYAGGGPGIFRPWAAQLPPEVELCAVTLPGRAHRLGERPLARVAEMVEQLVPSLEPWLDRPFALFGHCLGGVQMYETAMAIRARSGRLPLHLFVSGGRAPSVYTPEQFQADALQFGPAVPTPGHPVSDEQVLEMMADLNFPQSSVLFDDAETRDLMLPVVRADLGMNFAYSFDFSRPDPRLPVPATVMGGRADPFVTRPHLEKWRSLVDGSFEILMRPGDHYFIHREESHWLRVLREKVQSWGQGS